MVLEASSLDCFDVSSAVADFAIAVVVVGTKYGSAFEFTGDATFRA